MTRLTPQNILSARAFIALHRMNFDGQLNALKRGQCSLESQERAQAEINRFQSVDDILGAILDALANGSALRAAVKTKTIASALEFLSRHSSRWHDNLLGAQDTGGSLEIQSLAESNRDGFRDVEDLLQELLDRRAKALREAA